MNERWNRSTSRLMIVAALSLLACGQRSHGAPEGQAPAASPGVPVPVTAGTKDAGHAPAAWKRYLPPKANVEEQVVQDLDGDGVPEMVVLSSQIDEDLATTEGATKEVLRMNLTLNVHVFARKGADYVELGRTEMTGGPQPLEVTSLKGDASRKFVIASAVHCGASCAGIELHVVGVRSGRMENLLDLTSVDEGSFSIAPDGALEVRHMRYSDDSRPIGLEGTRYVANGGALVLASERNEPLPK